VYVGYALLYDGIPFEVVIMQRKITNREIDSVIHYMIFSSSMFRIDFPVINVILDFEKLSNSMYLVTVNNAF
jgi:hypothetical protein